MDARLAFALEFHGSASDRHLIDLYDVSQALEGFQRSLALTAHLAINGSIITQAPALKGAQIFSYPPQEGSWKTAAVLVAGAYAATTAPRDTPLGHVIHSIYDYVISESLGFHVDYDKTLQQLHDEHRKQEATAPRIEQHQLDSLVEKCSGALIEIHRPIFKTKTATSANITVSFGGPPLPVGGTLSASTFDYLRESHVDKDPKIIAGRVSSYNNNTFKGRIYVKAEGRPIPFELADTCRSDATIRQVTRSLSVNAVKEYDDPGSTVHCKVLRHTSRAGHLKSYTVLALSNKPISE
jgi:hypothetical protein